VSWSRIGRGALCRVDPRARDSSKRARLGLVARECASSADRRNCRRHATSTARRKALRPCPGRLNLSTFGVRAGTLGTARRVVRGGVAANG